MMYKKLEIKTLLEFTQTLKILYIEDHEDSREALHNLLKNFFSDITLAFDGLEGLEKLKNNRFDLIITDIKMPKMSGIELIKIIRETINEDTPLIVSTAHQDQDVLIECIELGVNSYLLKPINHKQLTRSIKLTCGKLYYMQKTKQYEASLERLVKEQTQELEAAKNALKIMTNKDPLTNLYNRRYFNEIAKTLLSIANREKDGLSLLMIDIDKFKSINDNYGHLTGDCVLQALASTLLKNIRSSDVAIRFGGEEFLLLLPHTHLEGAKKIAKKIKDCIKNLEIHTNDSPEAIKVTVSIGVSECQYNKNKDIDLLVHRADEAMYQAKKSGRDKIVIYEEDL